MKLFPRWNYELELWELYGRQDRKGRGRVAGTYARRKMGHATLIMTCNRDPKKKASHAGRPFPTVSFYCCCCCCCCDVACCTLLVARCTLHVAWSAKCRFVFAADLWHRLPEMLTAAARCNRPRQMQPKWKLAAVAVDCAARAHSLIDFPLSFSCCANDLGNKLLSSYLRCNCAQFAIHLIDK